MPNPLDIRKCRNQLTIDLYCYGQKKLLDGYESFSEKKERLKAEVSTGSERCTFVNSTVLK